MKLETPCRATSCGKPTAMAPSARAMPGATRAPANKQNPTDHVYLMIYPWITNARAGGHKAFVDATVIWSRGAMPRGQYARARPARRPAVPPQHDVALSRRSVAIEPIVGDDAFIL